MFKSRHWDLGSLIFTKLFLLWVVQSLLLHSPSLPISTLALLSFLSKRLFGMSEHRIHHLLPFQLL